MPVGTLRNWVRRLPPVQRLGRLVGRRVGPLWLDNPDALRDILARKFLAGAGQEIGALNKPQALPRTARACYVDHLPLAELRAHYPNLRRLVPVHVVDDGESLRTVADGSQDFLIANHFLEHTQNPIGTVRRFLEVLRPGGILFLAVPDKRGTFDVDRPLTTLEHLRRDDAEGPAWSYLDHVPEFVHLAVKARGAEAEAMVEHFVRTNYSIHFHVWDHDSLWAFLLELQPRLRFSVQAFVYNEPHSESLCVLKKTCRGGA